MTVGAGAGLETTGTRRGWNPSGAARDFWKAARLRGPRLY